MAIEIPDPLFTIEVDPVWSPDDREIAGYSVEIRFDGHLVYEEYVEHSERWGYVANEDRARDFVTEKVAARIRALLSPESLENH